MKLTEKLNSVLESELGKVELAQAKGRLDDRNFTSDIDKAIAKSKGTRKDFLTKAKSDGGVKVTWITKNEFTSKTHDLDVVFDKDKKLVGTFRK